MIIWLFDLVLGILSEELEECLDELRHRLGNDFPDTSSSRPFPSGWYTCRMRHGSIVYRLGALE
jgi:hypothetical protein